jgi:drug/metabolite transporter (DMT)-like permease
MSVASVILLLYFAIKSPKSYSKLGRSMPWLGVLGAILLSYNYFGFMKGVELTTASNAQIMIQSGPLLLLLAGVFYFGEVMARIQWFGVAGAFIGFTLFHLDQAKLNLSGEQLYSWGNVWIFTGAAAWAVFAVFQKILLKKNWSPGELNLLTYFVCAIVLSGPADFAEFQNLSFVQMCALLFVGLNTVVAYGAFAEAMNLIPASHVSLIITSNPLLTIVIVQVMDAFGASFIPPEPLGFIGIAGALLVVTGVAIAVGTPLFLQRQRRKKSAGLGS